MAIKGTEIIGLKELMRAFIKLGDEAMPRLKQAADAAGAIVLAKTKAKVPVKTGKLHDSLTLKKMHVKKGKYVNYSRVTFPSKVKYGIPLELGHKIVVKGRKVGTVKEKPYLRPAADESKEQVISIIVTAMNKALDEMGGKR